MITKMPTGRKEGLWWQLVVKYKEKLRSQRLGWRHEAGFMNFSRNVIGQLTVKCISFVFHKQKFYYIMSALCFLLSKRIFPNLHILIYLINILLHAFPMTYEAYWWTFRWFPTLGFTTYLGWTLLYIIPCALFIINVKDEFLYMELLGVKVMCILNFVSYCCQIILQSSDFHSPKHLGMMFISPQSHQHWMLPNLPSLPIW